MFGYKSEDTALIKDKKSSFQNWIVEIFSEQKESSTELKNKNQNN